MAERIIENMNSDEQDHDETSPTGPTLDEVCAATLRRRGRRGRPKGTGRKHPDRCTPKTFRHFSPLAHVLLMEIHWTGEYRKLSEAEIVEEALVRMGRSLSNQSPLLARRFAKAGQ